MEAKDAIHSVEHAAGHARGSMVELATQALEMINSLRAMRAVDFALGRVGLRRRESVLVPIGIFAAGAVVGGMVGMMVAPSTGKTLRKRVARFLSRELDDIEEAADKAAEKVAAKVADVRGNATHS